MSDSPFDPYRALDAIDVDFYVEPLDADLLGYYDGATREVRVASGLLQVERRCTAAHEFVHALRDDEPTCSDWHEGKQERTVHEIAARLLIPIDDLARALRWSNDLGEVADELWVDADTLVTRLRHLRPSERRRLGRCVAARDG